VRPRRAVRFARLTYRCVRVLGGPTVRAACGGNPSLSWLLPRVARWPKAATARQGPSRRQSTASTYDGRRPLILPTRMPMLDPAATRTPATCCDPSRPTTKGPSSASATTAPRPYTIDNPCRARRAQSMALECCPSRWNSVRMTAAAPGWSRSQAATCVAGGSAAPTNRSSRALGMPKQPPARLRGAHLPRLRHTAAQGSA
jgi:hypothetical protein